MAIFWLIYPLDMVIFHSYMVNYQRVIIGNHASPSISKAVIFSRGALSLAMALSLAGRFVGTS